MLPGLPRHADDATSPKSKWRGLFAVRWPQAQKLPRSWPRLSARLSTSPRVAPGRPCQLGPALPALTLLQRLSHDAQIALCSFCGSVTRKRPQAVKKASRRARRWSSASHTGVQAVRRLLQSLPCSTHQVIRFTFAAPPLFELP